jgi:hypothetical protein
MAGLHNLLHAPHFACVEPDLDASRVERGCLEDVLHNAAGEFPGTLILFLRDVHPLPWLDVFAVLPVHALDSFTFQKWQKRDG